MRLGHPAAMQVAPDIGLDACGHLGRVGVAQPVAPPRDRDTALGEIAGNPLDEVRAQLLRLHAGFRHHHLTGGRLDPGARRLVRADMICGQRHPRRLVQRGNVVDHCVDEAIGAVDTDVQRVVVIMLNAGIAGGVARLDQPETLGRRLVALRQQPLIAYLHRPDRRARMAGHVEGRDDGDLSRLRGAQYVGIIGGGQIAVGRGILGGVGTELRLQARLFAQVGAAIGPHLGQFGQARDLQAPALVIAQMEMECVELVGRHLLDQLQDLGLAMEVARQIDVQPAKAIARRILDDQRAERRPLRCHLLRQRA